uniref:Envelope glycoprotein n=1 Tax=Haemonchus contortus TaxID=6289 RepID=A0A7I4YJ44_HAECO
LLAVVRWRELRSVIIWSHGGWIPLGQQKKETRAANQPHNKRKQPHLASHPGGVILPDMSITILINHILIKPS